jgi:hypothetical protein
MEEESGRETRGEDYDRQASFQGNFEERERESEKDLQEEFSIVNVDSSPRPFTHIDKLRHGSYKQIMISASREEIILHSGYLSNSQAAFRNLSPPVLSLWPQAYLFLLFRNLLSL